jgi:2-polyprenyl-3-methyl-5-hydroxy-6-metoxy-1,4-benzoquinol methylase
MQQQTHVVMQSYDDRYGYPGMYELMCCSNCGHTFLNCFLTPSQLSELYTNYYPRKTFDLAQFQPHVEEKGVDAWLKGLNSSAFRRVPKNVRVLDVGCGFGQSLGYHTARGCDVYGVEADENIRRVAEKFGFKVQVGLFNDSLYESNFFDYVTMDQVIEHISDPLAALRGIARILKSGGTAILSTPNAKGWGAKLFGRRWINWHTPYHMQFFSRRSIRLAAEQAGLVVTDIKTITNSEWLLYQWIHLATYPNPGEASHFWMQNRQGLTSLQKQILSTLEFIHRYKLNHLLTRLFDSLGLGDNYAIVLKKQ